MDEDFGCSDAKWAHLVIGFTSFTLPPVHRTVRKPEGQQQPSTKRREPRSLLHTISVRAGAGGQATRIQTSGIESDSSLNRWIIR